MRLFKIVLFCLAAAGLSLFFAQQSRALEEGLPNLGTDSTKEETAPLPDLTIQSIGNFFLAAGGDPRVPMVLANIGQGNAGNFKVRHEWLSATGEVLNTCFAGTTTLNSGARKTIHALTCDNNTDSRRAVKLRTTIDSENTAVEIREDNNVKEKAMPLSDLRISEVSFKGQDKLPEITVINKGSASTGRNFYVTYEWFDIDGQRLGVCQEKLTVLGLNKKYTQKKPFCGNSDTYAWATKFKVTVDVGQGEISSSDIPESNENNNSLELAIPGRANLRRIQQSPLGNLDDSAGLLPSFPAAPAQDNTSLSEVAPVDTVETPPADAPVATPGTASDSYVAPTEPAIETTPTTQTPAAPIPTVSTPAPAPVVAEEIVREPSFSMTVTQNNKDVTVNGKIDYYGKGAKCSGPRPNDPVIVRWGDAASEPAVVNGAFSASHTYFIKNSSYTLSVSVYNSCYGMKTLTKKMLFTF